jgi:hypothetical protein
MNTPDETHPPNDEMHTGYDLEQGLLARVREWTDVFPWLRLIRTLRVTGSPVLVGLVAATFIVWWHVQLWIAGDQMVASTSATVDAVTPLVPDSVVGQLLATLSQLFPIQLFASDALRSQWQTAALLIAWTLLAWLPIALFLTRQGALLTAGRSLVGAETGIRRALRIAPAGWLLAGVPLACVLVFGLMIIAAGWLARLVGGIGWLEAPLALLIAIIAIPCGLLGFGAYVAVPLGWAALANEQDPDSLDALSRGYEYLYRRPLHVVLYATISSLVLLIIAALAWAIARVAGAIATAMLAVASPSEEFSQIVLGILGYYPLVVTLTLFWALVGGVYLLLRRDAGEQEVEDIWQPAPTPKPPLPELPVAANVVGR